MNAPPLLLPEARAAYVRDLKRDRDRLNEQIAHELSQEPTQTELPVLTFDELVSRKMDPVRFVIDQLVPSGGLTFWNGKWGSRKTWGADHAAICVATGKPFVRHFEVKQGTALILALEGGLDEHQRRIMALAGDVHGIPLYTFEGGLQMEDQQQRDRLKKTIERIRPDFIVLDHARAAFGGEENDSERARNIQILIRQMQDVYPSSWNLIAHLGKDKTKGQRGSSGQEDIADSMLDFEWLTDDRGTIAHRKAKRGREYNSKRPFEFIFTGEEAAGGAGLVYAESGPVAQPEVGAVTACGEWVVSYLKAAAEAVKLEKIKVAAKEVDKRWGEDVVQKAVGSNPNIEKVDRGWYAIKGLNPSFLEGPGE